MARGMLRGAAAAWLGLIALQATTTSNGAGAVGGLFTTIDGLVKRVLDPTVPAIPDHSTSSSLPAKTPVLGSDGQPTGGYLNDKGQYIPPTDSTQQQPVSPQLVPKQETYIPWPSTPGLSTA